MQRISFDPDSPTAGGPYKVCYDFDGLGAGVTSVTLRYTHSPAQPGDPKTVKINRPSTGTVACATVSAPSGATAATFEDLSGNSPDNAVVFS